jgi:hypothetical protein
MSCRGLIAAVATVAAILSGDAGAGLASPQSREEPDLAAYDLGIAAAVRSDLTASVELPDGGQVYVFGDTLAVNGQVICGPSHCPYGYPHDSIAIQRPGTATFRMQSCPALPGTMLVSWASNHDAPGTTCDMRPQFTDLPIGSPPPGQTARNAARLLATIIAFGNRPGLKESCRCLIQRAEGRCGRCQI